MLQNTPSLCLLPIFWSLCLLNLSGRGCSIRSIGLVMGILVGLIPSMAAAGKARDNDIAELKRMLQQQQAVIEDQGRRLQRQEELLNRLTSQGAMPTSTAPVPVATLNSDNNIAITPELPDATKPIPKSQPTHIQASAQIAPTTTAQSKVVDPSAKSTNKHNNVPIQSDLPRIETDRDRIGDMNAAAVKAGTFPGSIKIPGPYDVSFGIGGFVKTVLIVDSNLERSGADFLPALIGTARGDRDGNTSIDASLTRLNFDARSPTPLGSLRGYVEFDLNKNNNGTLDPKFRHAYGSLKSDWGTLTVGQTWTTFMDLNILPESVTEPTVSGAIFQRQPLLRYTYPYSSKVSFDLAVEDPNSNDVFSQEPELGRSPIPDVVGAVEFSKKGTGHFRLSSIYRRIELARNLGQNSAKDGWGVSSGAHLDLFEKDRLMMTGTYGLGIGRYLLGIAPTAGGVIDPVSDELNLRDNFGGLIAYQRFWTSSLRSNFAYGYAQSATLYGQPGDAFKSTMYAYGNLMWSLLPYLTVGLEYDYGVRQSRNNDTLDNSRFLFGIQMF